MPHLRPQLPGAVGGSARGVTFIKIELEEKLGRTHGRSQRSRKPMIEQLKRAGGVWRVLGGGVSCPWARAELGRGLVESARLETKAKLTPEETPRGERKSVWAANILGCRLLTGQAERFGVGFGNMVPAAGR